ncbi:tRNA glutamyl-Q(34) synthetase GluQRS [Candidatus Vondammii sp. HM_W22]|uniref:tRNA glutamyl-Q(34) synthetase GluQRS n=1 Tax=Candidatus Vondammii sp. HM_W22 TaxID=2687299 RepID=UPI001F1309C9|nr:tRNA glutamyl-Q(34) synthetase GluQRS [Candidatus Vondammii sp. HM_W22]
MTRKKQNYRGRFAPSPTGPLHFGSLVAAMGSYLDARSRGGAWLVRMEDLDTPREIPGAASDILQTLERFGFEWDGEVLYQSSRQEAYREALATLISDNAVFPCSCSRREVAEAGLQGMEGPRYSGKCRQQRMTKTHSGAVRVRTHQEQIQFKDRICKQISQNLELDIGDFIVRRADGLFAYQLAVVVDDAFQQVNQIVRGADLLCSTPRQIHLQQLLGLTTPEYAHLPLVLNDSGQKLSKKTGAFPVDKESPLPSLIAALEFLNQPLPNETPGSLSSFWEWAIAHWSLSPLVTQEK